MFHLLHQRLKSLIMHNCVDVGLLAVVLYSSWFFLIIADCLIAVASLITSGCQIICKPLLTSLYCWKCCLPRSHEYPCWIYLLISSNNDSLSDYTMHELLPNEMCCPRCRFQLLLSCAIQIYGRWMTQNPSFTETYPGEASTLSRRRSS